ncbi:sigma 54-interacting transcriptional regulator [bacterium]|nr:sigma 54-interacting transcriptional regulator [bacterium]
MGVRFRLFKKQMLITDYAQSISQLNSLVDSENLPEQMLSIVREILAIDEVLLARAEGSLLDIVEHSDDWIPKEFSLDVIRKALESKSGYWRGSLEKDPSESQILHNILSCIAARIDCGNRKIGVIYGQIREGERRFNDHDGLKLKALADLIAVYFNYYLLCHNQKGSTSASVIHIDERLIGETPAMKSLKKDIQRIAKVSSIPILIRGERGCGKEIVAWLLHALSDRASRELVIIHGASITKDLFESELFGHEKGAFTGADRKREGKVRRAEGGTLFFDEVADTPLEFQVKLLRFFQNKTFYRVGSDVPTGPVDVRFVFATNRDLEKMMEQGLLREDFYDRITMGRVLQIPPLKERLDDVPLLARRFAVPKGIAEDALILLERVADWPGNVRQLESIVHAAATESGALISRDAIAAELAIRKLVPMSTGANKFSEVRRSYNDGSMNENQVRELLISKFSELGAWSKVARNLGCSSRQEVKSFQQWVFHLQRQGIVPKDRESLKHGS